MIYLDYNASTPVDPSVSEAMRPFLQDMFGNPSSIHEYGVKAKQAVENARARVAGMINAHPDEIVFTSGGTESNNYAIKGIAYANRHKGNRIIVSAVEHPSIIEVCKYLETKGFVVTYIPVNSEGFVDLPELEKQITSSTILISVMHANNETGTIQPVNAIGKIARKHGIPFHSDAAQSCCKIHVDVEEMQADLLTVAGHKCYAPKGVGALYIRRGVTLEKLIHGADHEQNLRAGTENVASITGLGKAAELSKVFVAEAGGSENTKKTGAGPTVKELTDRFFNLLQKALPEIRLNGPMDNRLPNTLNISFPGVEANLLLGSMKEIAASAGAACHSGTVNASSVLKAMGVPDLYAMGTVRFSLGRMTTASEIEKAVPEIIQAYRKLAPGGEQPLIPSPEPGKIRLTQCTHSLGCACKIRPRTLEQLLRDIPVVKNQNILVGLETSDDAAVYRINDQTAIAQTVDFIPPVVDDPYQYGAIAAANSLSDIYAMGAIPLFALNIVAFPANLLPLEVLAQILKGASDKAAEAGITIIGGHTIEDTEPKFGLVATGSVHPEKIITNAGAAPGDAIILTKPLGTGILTTGMKRGMTDTGANEAMIRSMMLLNNLAAGVMADFPVKACTDVTGFGLLGHLKEMVKGSHTGARIDADHVPLFPGVEKLAAAGIIPGGTYSNLESVEDVVDWDPDIPAVMKLILADAQTSGGLLIAVPQDHAGKMLRDLHKAGISEAAVIGAFTEGDPVIKVVRKLLRN